MFAIYACSITSMTDHDCQSQLCETKSALLARYRFATKQALINVGFMRSSDLTVVEAFVLYIVSYSLFAPACLLKRICGLIIYALSHYRFQLGALAIIKSSGSTVVYYLESYNASASTGTDLSSAFPSSKPKCVAASSLDIYSSELSGVGTSLLRHPWDTRMPLNINDSDLSPNMKASRRTHWPDRDAIPPHPVPSGQFPQGGSSYILAR